VGRRFCPPKYQKATHKKTTQARAGLDGLMVIRQVNGGQKSVAHPTGLKYQKATHKKTIQAGAGLDGLG
jgi:hypothetical protein